jgi:hypothetical protein
MAWAANHKTTRKEDEAYCLLGIFNIYMPLIYSEGNNAMARLRRKIDKSIRHNLSPQFPEVSTMGTYLSKHHDGLDQSEHLLVRWNMSGPQYVILTN